MQKYLVFSEQEYAEKVTKLQKLMAQKGMGGTILSKWANLVYFTGYKTTLYNSEFRPFLAVVPTVGSPTLIVPNLEYGGAVKTSWVEDVRIWGGTKGCAAPDAVTLLKDVLTEKKLADQKVGLELSSGQRMGMTNEQFRQLQAVVPKMEIMDNESVIWPIRMIKSPKEIEYHRKSCRAADRAFDAAVETIRDGATEKKVAAAMAIAMMNEGADLPAFLTVTAGVNRYDMMNPFASDQVIMKKGDMVVMDFGCTYNGYYSDMTRGVFVGEPNQRAAELYKAVKDVNEHALREAKPGRPISAIDAAAEKRIIELGYRDLMLHRTGHSLGLEVHENPSIWPGEPMLLQEGMVLAIEPGLYDYSVGGFRIENNIVITQDGFEYLTESSQDIIIK
ncbi:MAG: Xaa-Pro peptidase family protein [Actinobacteria bacterium]|nr:Xaa-Pro peptidase family protein [Actinomycetota bacterium]